MYTYHGWTTGQISFYAKEIPREKDGNIMGKN
jgi:hypothetical protein